MSARNALPDRKEVLYSQIHHQVLARVAKLMPHEGLKAEISNRVLLSFLQVETQVFDLDRWIQTQTEHYLETCMKDLWKSAYQQARHLNLENEEAEDLAQNALLALLKTKEPIQYPRAWIKNTVQNQVFNLIRNNTQSRKLYNQLKHENLCPTPDDKDLDRHLSQDLLKKLLSKSEYNTLKVIQSFPNLKEYAVAMGISHSTARENKRKLLANLKAKYYTFQGWKGTTAILDYRSLLNINRFIEVIIERARLQDFSSVYHYATPKQIPELQECLSGFSEVTKWEISLLNNDQYELCLLDAKNPAQAKAVFFYHRIQ